MRSCVSATTRTIKTPLTSLRFGCLLFLLIPSSLVDRGGGVAAESETSIVRNASNDYGTPSCTTDDQCVIGGYCRRFPSGVKRCMCSTSCFMTVPVRCAPSNTVSCLTMGEDYVKKYNVSTPYCLEEGNIGRCVCPPQFDPLPVKPHPIPGFPYLLPMKCDKRDLQIMVAATPSDSVYKGTEATFYCCVNMDPRDFVAEEAVYFVQNGTRRREANSSPYSMFMPTEDTLFTVPTCWSLTIQNVQPSDSGSYSCIAFPNGNYADAKNETMYFTVKTPRTITNVTIKPNSTHVDISWDIQEGPMLKIGLKVFNRMGQRKEIWKADNVKSPVHLSNLEPSTPYSIFFFIQDGHAMPYRLTEYFQTAEGQSDPPVLEEIHLVDTPDYDMTCKVVWRPPHNPRGQIRRYFVQLSGKIRYRPPEAAGTKFAIDFPLALPPCQNYDGTSDDKAIDAKQAFSICIFGHLKPNRNYTATIWAENGAGKSEPVTFPEQCAVDFAQPEHIEPPEVITTKNVSSFELRFPGPPAEANGPIACYYLAIVPLPSNVSIPSLPKPDILIMDSFEQAMLNNVATGHIQHAFYGYIAESYMHYPTETIVGDNKAPAAIEPCNVYYMSRYKAEDPPLQPDLKYTGFLIVRVDRDKSLHTHSFEQNLFPRPTSHPKWPRIPRQLSKIDPAYGYSAYFKPIYLQQPSMASSAFHILLTIFMCLLVACGIAAGAFYVLKRNGMLYDLCPMKKSHTLLTQTYGPIVNEDLPTEFVTRHRDTDFIFLQEFDSVPKPKYLDFTTCDKKENARKNRYNDIKSCEETRVKLMTPGPDGSDYINANVIRGYEGKKTFIAAQAPLENTISDFWQMIWEQDVRIILMVANINERGRKQADKYWPNLNEPTMTIGGGNFEVTCHRTNIYADYIKRELEITHVLPTDAADNGVIFVANDEPESDYANVPALRPASKASQKNMEPSTSPAMIRKPRRITHYHFVNWTDLKAPDTTGGILRLMLQLRKTDDYNRHPVCIHCSAGVGRTGTFIAIDYCMDQAAEEGKINVFSTVAEIREQRNAVMVQSPEQYVFIYRALAEHMLFGDTDIPADAFESYVLKLKMAPRHQRVNNSSNQAVIRMAQNVVSYDLNGGPPASHPTAIASLTSSSSVGKALNAKIKQWKSGSKDLSCSDLKTVSSIEAEYQKLFISLDLVRSTSIATREENIHRNRSVNVVPYDRYRVTLKPRIGSKNQYYNATPYRGYLQQYIMAQDPIDAETCYEFWQLIDDEKTKLLVMLSREDEFEPCERFWPNEISVPLILGSNADLTVRLVAERIHPFYVERKMTYCFKREDETFEVTQFAFTGWPVDSPSPQNTKPFLDLVSKITTRQQRLSDPCNTPIIVHARDGSCEPGLLVCIAVLLERLISENMVDVFRTARAILHHRQMVFPHLDQYIFIHDAVVDFLRATK